MANQSSTPFDQGLFLVHLNRGREHFDARNFSDAAEELEEARRLRPGDDTVLNLLGLAYFKQEKYREADAVYRKLIELNPESSTLFFNLGLVCFKLADLDRAEATFLRALELKPDNQKTHFYLGNIYEKKKQYYNAIFQYRKAGANIMVKRVQEKIDRERPADRTDGEDFALPASSPDDTKPTVSRPPPPETTAPDLVLDKVNVDTIDRRRILSALGQGLFIERGTQPPTAPPPPSRPAPPEASLEELVERAVTTSDTQETLLSAEERNTLADEAKSLRMDTENTIPPPPPSTKPVGAETTRLRLSEPLVQDESLAEMARRKEPSAASSDLFFRQPERGRPVIVPAESLSDGDRQSVVQGLNWGATPSAGEPHVYARGRRRDDLFRYLEDNLLEVNFSGKVFIKQGTIYSYSGNLTFWVKPQRQESAPALVIVSGTGKLLLTDREREITVLAIEDDEIYVEPSHLLACQETLTPRYGIIEREGGKSAFHVLVIQGTGMLALSVASSPLVLAVQKPFPVNVSTGSIISWSGDLIPTIVEDEALAELMLPGTSTGMNLRLEGEGRVMMEKLTRG
ncbi:MAG TPA: tetratricopeptide repeat protein [Vicinamibacteria bacterium]|nr:tetratricopeptide repeat protein [Vicinamibacteria bacterium]